MISQLEGRILLIQALQEPVSDRTRHIVLGKTMRELVVDRNNCIRYGIILLLVVL